MRRCIQMTTMRSEKTHPTATLAHQKKHLAMQQSRIDQELVNRKD